MWFIYYDIFYNIRGVVMNILRIIYLYTMMYDIVVIVYVYIKKRI